MASLYEVRFPISCLTQFHAFYTDMFRAAGVSLQKRQVESGPETWYTARKDSTPGRTFSDSDIELDQPIK